VKLHPLSSPVKAAGNNEVQDEPEVAVNSNGDAFANAAEFADDTAFGVGEWRLDGAKEERTRDSNALERLTNDAGFEGGEVGGDIGEFGHADQIAGRTWEFATSNFAQERKF
jgi:hypothetical protein